MCVQLVFGETVIDIGMKMMVEMLLGSRQTITQRVYSGCQGKDLIC